MAPIRYTHEQAWEIARRAGYIPQGPYPGLAGVPWRVKCETCKQIRHIALSQLHNPRKPCKHMRPYMPNGRMKLPVTKIVKKYDAGMSIAKLAVEYGVSAGTIHRRLKGRTTLRPQIGGRRPRRAETELAA